jgi:hypothetical protein
VKRSRPERQCGDAPAATLAPFSISGKNVCGAPNCVFAGGFAKNGCFCDGFLWCFCGEFVVFLWWMKTRFLASKKMPTFQNIFLYTK